jgi:hypothetical protein
VITREDRWVALPANHHLADRPIILFEDLADETFEAVASGLGIVLLSAGNAEIYREKTSPVDRSRVGLPVSSPSSGAQEDHREAARVFIDA